MVVNPSGSTEDIIIPVYSKVAAKETNNVKYKCNLDSRSPILPPNATAKMRASAGITTNIDTYDAQGNTRRMTMTFWKTGPNQWTASAAMTDTNLPVTLDVPSRDGQNQNNPNSRINLTFSPDGKIISVGDNGTPDELNQGELIVNANYRVAGDPNIRNISLNLGKSGLLEGITQNASQSTTKAVEQDGWSMGYMEAFNIDDSGKITAVFSNGTKQTVGQVAMAVFTNPQGLIKKGDNMYEVSNNSGAANIGAASNGGRGTIKAGTLEMSNVDLSEQFVDMIVTQRGFQANSRSITTSDQMLQELLNLKR
jgi:flagellar hook protein FlgE